MRKRKKIIRFAKKYMKVVICNGCGKSLYDGDKHIFYEDDYYCSKECFVNDISRWVKYETLRWSTDMIGISDGGDDDESIL